MSANFAKLGGKILSSGVSVSIGVTTVNMVECWANEEKPKWDRIATECGKMTLTVAPFSVLPVGVGCMAASFGLTLSGELLDKYHVNQGKLSRKDVQHALGMSVLMSGGWAVISRVFKSVQSIN
jgi:hypothetical protein